MGKNLHKGYYGQYSGNSKFSKRHDEDYDAKEAYNKNKEIGIDDVNTYKMYIKFICATEEGEQI